MVLMLACGLLGAGGLWVALRWGRFEVVRPWEGAGQDGALPPAPVAVVRRYLWYVDLAVISGIIAGLLVAGPGGRLAMRLLAATAGDAAQGRLTEAEFAVGEITVGGTIGLVVFVGVFGGMFTSALFLLVRRWLPGGRAAGLSFGLLLLVVGATRLEPLRAGNPDFGLVGPGWLAVAVFTVLVVVHAMAVAAVAGRVSRALPLLSGERRTWRWHVPLLLLVPTGVGALVVAVAAGAVAAASRVRQVGEGLRSTITTTAGRLVLAAGAAAALPGFVRAVADIAGRPTGVR